MVEVGLVGTTMHQVDERVEVAHIHQLKAIYTRILADYFAAPPVTPVQTVNCRSDAQPKS